MRYLLLMLGVMLYSLSALAFEEAGVASWYGGKFQGRQTANGEIFDTYQLSAAHKTLPFGTIVTVQNLENGKTLQVRINDRGPYIEGRIIDLSYAAARELGILNQGVANVRITAPDGTAELASFATIQVGAFKNVAHAKRMKEMLTEAGLKPHAIMTSSGIVRIEIKNVLRKDAASVVAKLKSLGIENPLVRT
jgi:rare lipoprotein A